MLAIYSFGVKLATVQLNLNLTFARVKYVVESLERFVERLTSYMCADSSFILT